MQSLYDAYAAALAAYHANKGTCHAFMSARRELSVAMREAGFFFTLQDSFPWFTDDWRCDEKLWIVAAPNATLAAGLPVCPDPGKGWWDGRPDYRTCHPAVYGRVGPLREGESGVYRQRFVPESSCPSGPCGEREEWIKVSH